MSFIATYLLSEEAAMNVAIGLNRGLAHTNLHATSKAALRLLVNDISDSLTVWNDSSNDDPEADVVPRETQAVT